MSTPRVVFECDHGKAIIDAGVVRLEYGEPGVYEIASTWAICSGAIHDLSRLQAEVAELRTELSQARSHIASLNEHADAHSELEGVCMYVAQLADTGSQAHKLHFGEGKGHINGWRVAELMREKLISALPPESEL